MESLPGVAGAGQSNLSTGVAALIQDQMVSSPISPVVRSFSPDQDFIEMDFDPGFESDGGDRSEDSGQGGKRGESLGDQQEEEQEEEEDLAAVMEEEEEDLVRDFSVSPGPAVVVEAVCLPLLPSSNNNNTTVAEKTPSPPTTTSTTTAPEGLLGCEGLSGRVSPPHPSSAPVLSPSEEVRQLVSMPRSRSLNSSLGECLQTGQPRTNRSCREMMQREALMFGGDQAGAAAAAAGGPPEQAELEDLMSALYRLTLPETPLPLRTVAASNRVMIWTEKEAVRKQVRKYQLTPKVWS